MGKLEVSERATARRKITQAYNGTRKLTQADLEHTAQTMFKCDEVIKQEMASDDTVTSETLENELDVCEEYRSKYYDLLQGVIASNQTEVNGNLANNLATALKQLTDQQQQSQHTSNQISDPDPDQKHQATLPHPSQIPKPDELHPNRQDNAATSHYKFKYPTLNITKFNSHIDTWFEFWCGYKHIHDDPCITDEQKLQYLLQNLEGPAHRFVRGYPPVPGQYEKAWEALRNRYAPDHMLTEYYVRKLFMLMLGQVTGHKSLSLSELFDEINTQVNNLGTLDIDLVQCSPFLLPLVESCLPDNILFDWNKAKNQHINGSTFYVNQPNNQVSIYDLLEFLEGLVQSTTWTQSIRRDLLQGLEFRSAYETPVTAAALHNRTEEGAASQAPAITVAATSQASTPTNSSGRRARRMTCIFCGKRHMNHDCNTAKTWPLEKKRKVIEEKKACFICLVTGHPSRDCNAAVSCILCGQRHQTIMCTQLPINAATTPVTSAACVLRPNQTVFLQTVTVYVGDSNPASAQQLPVRALLDSGSEKSYITSDLAQRLELTPFGQILVNHSLFGNVQRQELHTQHRVRLKAKDQQTSIVLSLYTQAEICHEIPRIQQTDLLESLRQTGITLSDQSPPDLDNSIGLLLGADVMGRILTGTQRHLGELCCIETIFGWTIMGQNPTATPFTTTVSLNNHTTEEVKLWDLETLGIEDPVEVKSKAQRQQEILENFQKTLQVDETERYDVRIPWQLEPTNISLNYEQSFARMLTVTQQLNNTGRFQDYHQEIQQWVSDGIVEVVTDAKTVKHYLPHRPVFKDHGTTKTRPVFDATSGLLNRHLEKGPNLLAIIPSPLTKFRLGPIGVTADIKKAFLQISINPADRDFLCFLWWTDETQTQVCIYRHTRVVFGLTCSPFLLMATLDFHLQKIPPPLDTTARQLFKMFYVDNLLTAVFTADALNTLIRESTEILALGKFELREWAHSQTITGECCRSGACNTNKDKDILPILGVGWNSHTDTLFINFTFLDNYEDRVLSRRSTLSFLHRIFDPLGILSPVLIIPKLIFRSATQLKLKWDTPLPPDLANEFNIWKKDLAALRDFQFPRCAVPADTISFELHTFCDASKTAFGTCIYLRCVTTTQVSVTLLQAKSRLAPLDPPLTIPKLELVACTIGSRLANTLQEILHGSFGKIPTYFWTDSSISYYWITAKRPRMKFAQNRIKEITTITSTSDWRHISGKDNPADILTRPCNVTLFLSSSLLQGPEWLYRPATDWPNSNVEPPQNDEDDLSPEPLQPAEPESSIDTPTTVSLLDNPEKPKVIYKSLIEQLTEKSSYYKAVRILARALTFISKIQTRILRRKTSKNPTQEIPRTNLSVTFAEAERYLIRWLQTSLPDVHTSPSAKPAKNARKAKIKPKATPSVKSTKNLPIFRDADGLLKVRTKLTNAALPHEFTSPIVLPSNHPLVHSLIRETHENNGHVGIQTTMTALREKFWVLSTRRTVGRILNHCVTCKRFHARPLNAPQAPLPANRVVQTYCFQTTGIDLGGPLFLNDGTKAWFILFTCSVYRAVHLELTQSLTTEAFILAFRRFIARKGRPTDVYCDNGTNLRGTDNLFALLDWTRIMTEFQCQRIKFRFLPPGAPWWGGFYERLVQSVKNILKSVLASARVSYEELYTVLCDAESVINSRPLTYVGEDRNDLNPLIPAMFFRDLPSSEVPDFDELEENHLRARARYRQELRTQLRNRFRSEYLALLIHRKSTGQGKNRLAVGDVVIVASDNVKRIKWPLGLVTELLPGADGFVRVAKVKTKTGEYLRPIQRIIPLEISHASNPQLVISQKSDVDPNLMEKGKTETVRIPNITHPPLSVPDTQLPPAVTPVRISRSGRPLKPINRLNLFNSVYEDFF